MSTPENLKYTKEHEWVKLEGETAVVGITDHAQDALGDVVYVELPEEGSDITKDEAFGVVESVKAVSDLYAPVSGKVIEVNDSIIDSPEVINEDPYGNAWLIKIEAPSEDEIAGLLSAEEYDQYVEEEK